MTKDESTLVGLAETIAKQDAEIEQLRILLNSPAAERLQEIGRLHAALMDAWRITNAILNKDQYLEAVDNILSRTLFPHIYEREEK